MKKLHIDGFGDFAWSNVENTYTAIVGTPTTQELDERRDHNKEMLEISFSISYSKFDNVKGCTMMKEMWDNLTLIYGGDTNVLRAKVESLRGKFDEMRMQEDETIIQY